MIRVLFLSHPQVKIEPLVPVPDWGLSDPGQARAREFAARCAAGLGGWDLVCSPERKAVQTATILATGWGSVVQVLPDLAEVDRRSTGYVPQARHDALALALFVHPDQTAAGWETARAAQARVCRAFDALPKDRDTVIIGHGGTGTLLWLALTGRPITPGFDQPHQGCGWFAQGPDWTVAKGWQAFEDLRL